MSRSKHDATRSQWNSVNGAQNYRQEMLGINGVKSAFLKSVCKKGKKYLQKSPSYI